jgi:hypothetical protein
MQGSKMKHSEIEFRFIRPLNETERDIFISYFDTMRDNVMDRLLAVIKGTDKNPLRALAGKLSKLGGVPVNDMIMQKYLKIYNDLRAQKELATQGKAGSDDIFVLDENEQDKRVYIFRMDMEAFDMSLLGKTGVPAINRELFNLMHRKDQQIGTHVMRCVIPAMGLKPSDCLIRTRLFDAEPKKEAVP